MTAFDHDYIVVGSGFGGAVCGLRLVEKGYDVLMLEKGGEIQPAEYPKSNWNLRRWMWLPRVGFRGFFKLTFMRHVTVLSGVGVGGGSIGYACTHPVPKDSYFQAPSWRDLADWRTELSPHYDTASRMLGITTNPALGPADELVREIAHDVGKPDDFEPTNVAIYFGQPGETVPDPYFGGEGPPRTGCIRCGGCMIGCRYGAKNSLDQNYLYLARKRGLALRPDSEVVAVRPLKGGGYEVDCRVGRGVFSRERHRFTARNVILAGGVMGTVKLLLRLRDEPAALPNLSPRLGCDIRTNSEVLTFVVSRRRDVDLSEGVAIGSILHTGEHSHLEPVRYSSGSGFWRLMLLPYVTGGGGPLARVARMLATVLRHPIKTLRTYWVTNFAKYSTVLLYMRTAEGKLRFVRKGRRMITVLDSGEAATANIPEAAPYIARAAEKLGGMALSGFPETLFDIPSTAHILGGCCMGRTAEDGVIDDRHRVFGYEGLYVIDSSAISANPGVNPSLSIMALAERAMTFIPERQKNPVAGP